LRLARSPEAPKMTRSVAAVLSTVALTTVAGLREASPRKRLGRKM